jgi:tryptophan-rich sensory protein
MLLYHILVPIVLAIIMNGIIYMFRLNKKDNLKDNLNNDDLYKKFLPPGYIIGCIWLIIFGLLGYVHYLIYKQNDNKITITSLFICFIILFCLSYPLITGLKVKSGIIMNLLSLILGFILGIVIITQSKYAFLFVLPLIIWASYVNIVILYNVANYIK